MKHLAYGIMAASTLIVGVAAGSRSPSYGQSAEGQESETQEEAQPTMGGHGPVMGMGMGMGPGHGQGMGHGNGASMGMGMGQHGQGGEHGEGKPGHMARHRFAMMTGIPAPYTDMTNPLEPTVETLALGGQIFADNCAMCHGPAGKGDGPDATGLSPAPADLAWLSDRPMGQRDPFLYWTVAEGGMPFDSAMPAFKDVLTEDEIWAVTTYVKAHLPQATE